MDQDLRFDDASSSFMFANDTSPVSHAFDIVVENRGGTTQLMNTGFGCPATGYSLNAFSHSFNPTQRIENCQVSRECGPWSTTVQCPEHPPATSTFVQGKAAVSNAACRVSDIALTEECYAQGFEITHPVQRRDNNGNLLPIDYNDYDVRLVPRDSFSNTVVREGKYEYRLNITTTGGGYAICPYTMFVPKTCTSRAVRTTASYGHCVPAEGSRSEVVPASRSELLSIIDLAGDGCEQTYSFRMRDGSVPPQELSLDSATGLFTLDNRASQKVDFNVVLVVTDRGGTTISETGEDVTAEYNGVTEIEMRIQSSCCADSTVVSAPECKPLFKVPNTTPLLETTGHFYSSNPTCPIRQLYLDQGDASFDLVPDGNRFTLTMEADDNTVERDYQYQVRAVAEGNAMETLACSKDIRRVCIGTLTGQITYD